MWVFWNDNEDNDNNNETLEDRFEDRSDVGEDMIQIQIQNLEWVDRDEDRSDVGEDPIVHEPLLQILAYCSLGYLNTK